MKIENIVILLPVLNEVENIAELLERLVKELHVYNPHILIIDDGSKDGTIEKIEGQQKLHGDSIVLLQRVKKEAGCVRGAALVHGLKYARKNFNPDIYIELDGDLSHQPEEIHKGLELMQAGADVALGSKYLAKSSIAGRSASRSFISYFNSLLLRLLMGTSISDYSNGFRVYNKKAAEVILNSEIKYGSPIYLAEALMLWKLHKLSIAEFPITYIGRKTGASKVIISDVFEGLGGAINIAGRYYRGQKQ